MNTEDELEPKTLVLPPLHEAARQRDVDAARVLLEHGADANEVDPRDKNGNGGNTPLWYAAQGLAPGGVPVAQLLLAAGADINAPGEFAMTPLHMACSWGHADMVRFLLEKGADPTAEDSQGLSPVALAHADYAEGLATPEEHRVVGWSSWLEGMAAISKYFAEVAL